MRCQHCYGHKPTPSDFHSFERKTMVSHAACASEFQFFSLSLLFLNMILQIGVHCSLKISRRRVFGSIFFLHFCRSFSQDFFYFYSIIRPLISFYLTRFFFFHISFHFFLSCANNGNDKNNSSLQDETRKKAASTYLVENSDIPPPRYQKDGTLPMNYPNNTANSGMSINFIVCCTKT